MKKNHKILIIGLSSVMLFVLGFAALCIFFDEAVMVRKGTIFRVPTSKKVVALTFDDGPSPIWTPQILDQLKQAGVKATFFMLGEHVERYPGLAKRVAEEGHEIGNHTYDHHVLIYYKPQELEDEINRAEKIIKNITGKTTVYFRPPKAWLTPDEKEKIKEMGYKIILWSLNSKDWVTFDDKYIIKYIVRNIQPGDIILFHDSGGALSAEGGNRKETVKAVPGLIRKLKEQGYRFVTVHELLENIIDDENKS